MKLWKLRLKYLTSYILSGLLSLCLFISCLDSVALNDQIFTSFVNYTKSKTGEKDFPEPMPKPKPKDGTDKIATGSD